MHPFGRRLLLTVTLMFSAALASESAAAQERTDEEHEVHHVYDDIEPHWERDADASVELVVPQELTVCRQGLVLDHYDGILEVHMGCWPHRPLSRMSVPSGPGFVGVRRGLDVTWLGGATMMHNGTVLRVEVDDRAPLRVVGWIVAGLSLATAIGLAVGLLTGAINGWEPVVGMLGAGVAFFVGIALAFLDDGLQIASHGGSRLPDESRD